jgi:hypothetical protein
MELHHYYFFTIKTLILIGTLLIVTGKIEDNRPLFLIMDTIFKMSLGFYLIYYFSKMNTNNSNSSMDSHDKFLFMISGFILLITINYSEIYSLITVLDRLTALSGSWTMPEVV